MNTVSLVGRWARSPELRYTADGMAVTNATIAVDRPFAKEGQQSADFISVTIWGKTAENVAQYTRKGTLVSIDGRIQTRDYEDREGKRIFVTEVVARGVQFLSQPKNQNKVANGQAYNQPLTGNPIEISDDDLPF